MRPVVILLGSGIILLGVGLRTRAIVGRDAGEAVVDVVREESAGRALVRRVADRAGVGPDDYDVAIWIGEDVWETILAELRADDLVCVGATRSTAPTQALFGSIPGEIASRAAGTMAIIRGWEYRPRSLVDAVVERLQS